MAIILNSKYPIDLNGRKAVGFNFPMNGDAVFNKTYIVKDQVKANLINYLLTNHGERLFKPLFGSDLRSLIFQAIEDENIESLKENIQLSISKYFPLVIINEFVISKYEDANSLNVVLKYSIKNYGIDDYLAINLQ